MADSPTPSQQPQPTGPPESIAYERFASVVSQRDALKADVERLKAEAQTYSEKAATADTLGAQLREAQEAAKAAKGRWGRWQTIAQGLGTTEQEAVEAAEWAYGRLPEKGRPKLGEWLTEIREKPDEAPKVLRPWLTESTAPEGGKKPPAGSSAPRPGRTGSTPPGAPSQVTAEQIRAAKEHGIRTGDWSRYRDLAESAGLRPKG